MIPETGRVLAALAGLAKRPLPACDVRPYPVLRNLILDVMDEGRRKNIINLVFEAEVGPARQSLAGIESGCGERLSLTSWIAKCLADTVAEDRRLQAYRHGRQLVVFDDVDLTLMVEREVEGELMPVPQIVRAANRKTVVEIHRELLGAREAPQDRAGSLSSLEVRFFGLPRFFRRLVWFFIRRDPGLFKQLLGTVGVTSLGMFASGPAVLLPITPMTLTLSIGAVSRRWSMTGDGTPLEHEVIHLNIGADHDVVDGAPLMRFIERLKVRIAGG